jgi:hypothetical protein
MRTLDEAKNYFVYHAPNEEQRELYERLNNMWLSVVEMVWELVPPFNQGSPDKTVALRHLSETRMATNMAVACYVPPQEVNDPDVFDKPGSPIG